MSFIPPEFEERLEQEFNGRLRVRWSPSSGQYRIEQKVARAQMWGDRPILENDDEATMIRDGYFYVMSIAPRDRMNCKRCNTELEVPLYEARVVACPICKLMGRTFKYAVAYFPLGDKLIDHLKKIDPERGLSRDQMKALRESNEALLRSQQRAVSNNAEAYGKDNFNRLVGIQQVGRTGRESAWLDAPQRDIINERQKQGILVGV